MLPALELLSVGEACREFAVTMNQQLDLRIEATHLLKIYT
jgi:predicted unusual protein kinase regulating ubiquinone biosynthesis (AarF/ABC1/UbiB family)